MTTWYLSVGGQQSGPYTDDQIRQMAQGGHLGGDAYLSGPGLAGWTPAHQAPIVQSSQGTGPAAQHAYGHPPMHQQLAAPQMAPAVQGAYGQHAVPQAAAVPRVRQSNWIRERLKGLGSIGIAFGVLALNVISIVWNETFYPESLILGLGAMGYGGWVVLFGDEYDDFTMELVRWKQVGMWGCAILGAVAGLLLSIAIGS